MTADTVLSGTRVAVVGGTSGFGLAVARRAVAAGAEVVLVGRDAAKLDHVLADLGPQATGFAADAADPDAAAELFDRIGDVDHLVSTLGGAMGGGFLGASFAEITETVDGKFRANLGLVRAAAPHLRPGGSVTLTAGAGGTPQDASGAVVGNQALGTLVRGLAVEMAPATRVNAVAPAWTPTPLWRDLTTEQLAATQRQMASLFPLQRTATVDEVADGYLFLMTAGFVTGQVLAVDGGSGLV